MAKPMTYQQTLSQMALWGLKVIEYPGWRTRGRDPEHGPFSDVHGIVIHHTGSDAGQSDDYLHFLAIDGRPALPGPLCNVSTDMDGDLHLIAQGRANHAGSGSSTTFNHVKAEDYSGYTSELNPGPDNLDGNAVYYGNEVRYDGGQPMTAKQYASAVRWAAAVCHFHGWSALSIIGHREHTRRKDDPGHCPMNKFRSDVAALLKAGPPSKDTGTGNTSATPPAKDDDVALTQAQELAIAKAGWLADQFAQGAQFETDLDTAIANGDQAKVMLSQVALKGQVDELKGELGEVKALLGQVLAKLPTPPTA